MILRLFVTNTAKNVFIKIFSFIYNLNDSRRSSLIIYFFSYTSYTNSIPFSSCIPCGTIESLELLLVITKQRYMNVKHKLNVKNINTYSINTKLFGIEGKNVSHSNFFFIRVRYNRPKCGDSMAL